VLILPAIQARLGAIPRLLYRLHLLNLDVALGALASNLMVRHVLQTPAYSPVSYFILGSTVWMIYTVDRLWDVYRTKGFPASPRHQFHSDHRKSLWWAVVALTILTAIASLYFLPLQVIWFGLVLTLLVALYLWVVHWLSANRQNWFQKEPLVAVLYTAGVWGPVMALNGSVSAMQWVLCLIFAGIAFQNLLLFSLFDLENDLQKQERSLATSWGPKRSGRVLNWLFAGILLTCLIIRLSFSREGRGWEVATIEAAMSLVLFVISCFPNWFRRNERFRWIGDGIFFMPLLVWVANN
jgi:4-hydroxybenzoate polyprenyltransferase